MENRKNVAVILENDYERPFRLTDGLLSVPGVRERCAFRYFAFGKVEYNHIFSDHWKPDGIIICYDEIIFPWLRELDIPIVNLVGWGRGVHPSVGMDHGSLAEAVVEHFDALEFRHLISLDTKGVNEQTDLEQYLSPLCAAKGIEYQNIYIRDGLDSADVSEVDEVCPEFGEAVRSAEKPVGVFARHDRRGRLVVDYLVSKGYAIPDEVAVLACFDSLEARLCEPPLSSVVLRDVEIGARGMQKLEQLMHGDFSGNKHETIPVRGVRVRSSTIGNLGSDFEILRARSIIRARAREGITVDMLLSDMKVSRSTFEKRFVALTGHSPAQEIREVRLEWARELLLTTDMPISRVASLVGFKDRRAFVVFFKREAGETPTEFRRAHRL